MAIHSRKFLFLRTVERASGYASVYALALTPRQYTRIGRLEKTLVIENRFFTFNELEMLEDFRDKDRELIRSLAQKD
ncbi:MAG: hypothetical protein WA021_03605 [Minisyncoccia bacterium]